MIKLAYLVSHPIQYHAPLFRALAQVPELDFEVLFCCDTGVRPVFDRGFQRRIRYDVPLTEGFASRFLWNVSPRPYPSFFGVINPGVVPLVLRPRHDAIILHGYGRPTPLAALLLHRPRRTPKLLMRGDSNSRAVTSAAKARLKDVALRALLSRVDCCLSMGARNAEYYRMFGVPDSRIRFAPHAVDNDYFEARSAEARADPGTARRRFGLPEGLPLFVFSGKLLPAKRPADAIQALAFARRRTPCALAIAGDGVLRASLEEEVRRLGLQEWVRFLGFLNQSELPGLYGCSDALVLPSGHEPWGLVVNEAMACGQAVLVSEDVGAAPDLVGPQNGRVVATGDVQALGEAMALVVGDAQRLAAMKQASRNLIRRWSIQACASATVDAVREVCGT